MITRANPGKSVYEEYRPNYRQVTTILADADSGFDEPRTMKRISIEKDFSPGYRMTSSPVYSRAYEPVIYEESPRSVSRLSVDHHESGRYGGGRLLDRSGLDRSHSASDRYLDRSHGDRTNDWNDRHSDTGGYHGDSYVHEQHRESSSSSTLPRRSSERWVEQRDVSTLPRRVSENWAEQQEASSLPRRVSEHWVEQRASATSPRRVSEHLVEQRDAPRRTTEHWEQREHNVRHPRRSSDHWNGQESTLQRRQSGWQDEMRRMEAEFLTADKSGSDVQRLLNDSSASQISIGSSNLHRRESGITPGVTPFHFQSDLSDADIQPVYITNDHGRPSYIVKLNLGDDISPDELYISTGHGNKITVDVKRLVREGNSTISRKLSRTVTLPPTVDMKLVEAKFGNDGLLIIEAPLDPPNYQDKLRETGFVTEWPIVYDRDGARKIRLSLLMPDFRPDEVKVKTINRKAVLHAESRTSGRVFHREYELPNDVDPFSVNAYTSRDGTVHIEAPVLIR